MRLLSMLAGNAGCSAPRSADGPATWVPASFPSSTGWRRAIWAALLCTTFLGVSSPTPARAQGDDQQAAAAQDGAEQTSHRPKSKLVWFIQSSGWIGAVIVLLSVYFIATVTRLFVELRQPIAAPPDLVKQCYDLLDKRDFKSVYTLVKDDDSDFARIVTAGLTELSTGLAEARDAMERVSESLTVGMEKKISMLAVLGTLGPMIGLLGTLKGMISSFSVIALSDTQLKASEVAGGISEALLLTFEGVALSVPAIYFFAVFRNRVSTISTATLLEADEYIRRFSAAARQKTAAAAPVGVAAVTNRP
ncbi:MAG TPA: MotA/TolQ/ExbB proton channel family protein [Pirellulales bacterium]|nr:MotA/TolQ/ExbB proton channel family protein [Pirellulales bacterium]